jgi:hypothetical protein
MRSDTVKTLFGGPDVSNRRPIRPPRMPFGKHKGALLTELPADYLDYLLGWPPLAEPKWRWLYELVLAERERRQAEMAERASLTELPGADPIEVCGIHLDRAESALFLQAVYDGELSLEPWLPIHNSVEEAWRRWCAQAGRPHRVVEVPIAVAQEEAPDERRCAS